MEDWIKKWYKDQYNKSLVNAPKSAWSKIVKELNDWPAHWYKSNSKEINIKPKSNLWDSISSGLPEQLTPAKLSLNYLMLSVLSFSLVLLSPFFLLNPTVDLNQKYDNYKMSFSETISSESRSSIIDSKVNNRTEINSEETKEYSAISSKVIQKNDFIVKTKGNENIINANSSQNANNKTNNLELLIDEDFIEEPISRNLSPITVALKSDILDIEEINFRDSEKNPIGNKWSIIAGATFQKTNLITPITYRAKTDDNIDMENSFNIGLNIGLLRELSSNNRLFGSLLVGDEKIQSYNVKMNNTIQHNELKVRSLSLSLGYEQKLWNIGSRSSLWYSTGIFSSYISSVEEFTDGIEQNRLSEGFRNIDFGVFSGLTFDYYFYPDIVLTSQVNYNIGAINIFEGVDKVPANFFQTRTSSLNVSLGIRISL